MVKTLSAAQLIKLLQKFPKHTLVYISSDSEGNSFGSLTSAPPFAIEYSERDGSLALMQFQDHLDIADIMPVLDNQIYEELLAEGKIKPKD